MTAKYFAILTNYGAAQLANAVALGTQMNISKMAVGDGGGTLPVPDPAQTKLVRETRRAAVNQVSIDEKNPNFIIAEQVIPENEGGWFIREIGLFDDKGGLIAVGNAPETYKPNLQEGSGRTQVIQMVLMVSSTQAITLKVDPSVVLATREYVTKSIDAAIQASEARAAQTYQQKGDYVTHPYLKLELLKKIDKADIAQQLGNDTGKVVSQNLLTTELGKKAGVADVNGKFDKTGGTISGAVEIKAAGRALKMTAPNSDSATYLEFFGGDTSVAFLGFGQNGTDNLTFANRKTGVTLRVGTSVSVNGSRVITEEDTQIPVGASVIWNSTAPIPANFWPNEGRSFSATDYPELAKVFPSLRLPDDRGYAIRIADNGRDIDSGRKVGTFQEDAIRNFTGWFGERDFRSPNTSDYYPFLWGQTGVFKQEKRVSSEGASPVMEKASAGNWSGTKFDPSLVVPTANENRMKNVAKILITRVK